MDFIIKYKDKRGNISERDITLILVDGNKFDVYDRTNKGVRTFLFSGIIYLIDINSGELIEENFENYLLKQSL